MISVTEAKKIINNAVEPLDAEKVSLHDGWDTVVAEDVIAVRDIPAYAQSSMDGYAFAFSDFQKQPHLAIAGEAAAGNRNELKLQPGTASRIFTGAAVPAGADTVVMQEKVSVSNGHLTINDETLLKGNNVRVKGSEVRQGDIALPKGSYVSAATVGFLAGIGVTHIAVHPKPRVIIIVTGNELTTPGDPLQHGEVYESNSYALTTALGQFHITPQQIIRVEDNAEILTQAIQGALSKCDMLLLTGGVSVGEYDFVTGAAAECDVTTLFHKVRQRPGKPLFFGMKEKKVVFGLPGNPSSVLTCFYEYVIPAVRKMSNGRQEVKIANVPLGAPFNKNIPFTQFLKGHYNGTVATPLAAQESYKMNSFAMANCLIVLEESDRECLKGDLKEIHLII